ncbi:MAG: carbonate dehydratase, partial [Rhodospirillaceae bacterium]|nr:carbonate dehydratase [Rhodospirillaceae bacterium]
MKLAVSSLAAGLIFTSFAGNISASEPSQGASQTASGPAAHWSYSGAEGPANWGELSGAYALCKSGAQQSPVNISHTQQAGLAAIDTDYRATALHVVNNGHTIQVNYSPGSRMILGNAEYELLQFHFHSPSENTLNGEHFDMEIHFVHKDAHGVLGVLGVFVEAGAE